MSDRIVIKPSEPYLLSLARDVTSFGLLTGTALLLNTQMQPSAWINAAIAICWILWLIGKGVERRITVTPDEARKWLDEHDTQLAAQGEKA